MRNESFESFFFGAGLWYVLFRELLECNAPPTHTLWSEDQSYEVAN